MKERRFPRDAWRLLLLLGFLCQGFACNSMVVYPLLYGGIWYAAWRWRQSCRRVPEEVELLILLVALAVTWFLQGAMNVVWFAAIGNGLVAFQLLRSYYQPPPRQKVMTAAVAITQVAIGAQAVFDYRFIPILAAAIVLIPRCLHQLEHERLEGRTIEHAVTFPRYRDLGYVAALMVVFFMFFPRIPVSTATGRTGLPTGPQRPSVDLSDTVGEESSEVLIFRIEGEEIDYVRSFALDSFDGTQWTASPIMERMERYPRSPVRPDDLQRRVQIHAFGTTREYLPTDGQVVRVRGDFRQRVYVAEHGGVMLANRLRSTVDYDYWTRPDRGHRPLDRRDWARYTAMPEPPSAALAAWLQETVGEENDPQTVARTLESWFRANCRYQLGAPRLDRDAALETFILQERTGHCGRYAAALAALLRHKGIPSRVVVGFLARERNEFGDFYSVRAKHAHAWTEAWIPDEGGWVRYDATPDGAGFEMDSIAVTQTLSEWAEHMWYTNIVNFGFREQESLLAGLQVGVEAIAKGIFSGWPVVLALVVLAAIWRVTSYLRALLRRRRLRRGDPEERRRQEIREAGHFYGQMVRALSRFRLVRRPSQTPREFLRDVESARVPVLGEVKMVTDLFCGVRYGEVPLTEERREQITAAISRIRKGKNDA